MLCNHGETFHSITSRVYNDPVMDAEHDPTTRHEDEPIELEPGVDFAFPDDPRIPDPEAPDNRALLAQRMQFAIDTMPGNFAAATIDINNLKEVNAAGHEAGDILLARTRNLLRTYVSEGYPDRLPDEVLAVGSATHTSGDEYWLILHGINSHDALGMILERINKKLFDELGISTSIGAHIHVPGESVRDMYVMADMALLHNKYQSRRRLSAEDEIEVKDILRRLGRMSLTVRDLGYYQDMLREEIDHPTDDPAVDQPEA